MELAAAAVLFLAFAGRRTPAKEGEQQSGPPPDNGGGGFSAKDFQQTVGVASTLITTGVGVAGAISKLAAGGATTAAGAKGAAVGGGGASGGASGFALGITAAGAGAFALWAIIVAWIVAASIGIQVAMQVGNKHKAQQDAQLPALHVLAREIFEKAMSGMIQRQKDGAGQEYLYGATVSGTPEEIRHAVLTCVWAAATMHQARNAVLLAYYKFINRPDNGQGTWGAATPGYDAMAHAAALNVSGMNVLEHVLSAGGGFKFTFPTDMSPQGRNNWLTMTVATTPGELAGAAHLMLGEKFAGTAAAAAWMGKLSGIMIPVLEGYGGIHLGWNNWPGDQKFTETVGGFAGWTAWRGVRWVTNAGVPFPLDTWWMLDAATGNAVAPLEAHNDNVLRVSVKGTPIIPSQPNGPTA